LNFGLRDSDFEFFPSGVSLRHTGLVSVPIFSISMLTVSPGFNHTGGVRAKPTPCGVPVMITVPGRSVLLPLRNSISAGTSKIMSLVFQSCIDLPVEHGADLERVGIGNLVAGHEHGAERAEGVEALRLAPLAAAERPALPVARGDVVAAGVAEHVVEGVGAGDVFAAPADDDREFALVVDLRAGEVAGSSMGSPGFCSELVALMKRIGCAGAPLPPSSACFL
jgi:hypothetical protein